LNQKREQQADPFLSPTFNRSRSNIAISSAFCLQKLKNRWTYLSNSSMRLSISGLPVLVNGDRVLDFFKTSM